MPTTLVHEAYTLSLEELYARMWAIGADDVGDGTRLFRPAPGSRQALKWLIEDLSGAAAHPERTTPANNALRQQAHRALIESGLAERINQVSFRLLVEPAAVGAAHDRSPEGLAVAEPPRTAEADGVTITDVETADITTDLDTLSLADLDWSPWHSLKDAATSATTSPGVYAARSDGQLVYIGMAGERRGLGVRGRILVYLRGRGAVSGLGEAALDRGLADPAWLSQRLTDLLTDGPSRSKDWAVAALQRAGLELCWAAAPDAATAREWEHRSLQEAEDVALWNRARPPARGGA